MERIKCTIEDLKKEIIWKDVFELRLNTNTPRLTENVTNIGFSNDQNIIYISFIDVKVVNDDYNLLSEITQENISKGIDIVLGDRNGEILARCEFENCYIQDISTIILDYNINQNDLIKKYIVPIKYTNMYLIK